MAGLIRSNLVVASGTAVSRITGLVRIVIFGMVIGQTALADAFDGANNAPNAIYELFIGGVLSASLVPLFARLVDNDHKENNDIDAIVNYASHPDAAYAVPTPEHFVPLLYVLGARRPDEAPHTVTDGFVYSSLSMYSVAFG